MTNKPTELEPYISRFTFDANTTSPGGDDYDAWRVVEVIKCSEGQWYVARAGMVLNRRSGRWVTDYHYRHDDPSAYVTDRDQAISHARQLIARLRR